jgi:hypothetical protein
MPTSSTVDLPGVHSSLAAPVLFLSEARRLGLTPVNGFLNWWDGIELWLSGLAFVLQALVVMPVVLALAYVAAVALDGLLGKGIKFMRRARHADGTPG